MFKVVGEEIEEFQIRIFNRWGELIYESQDYLQGWDGTINNEGKYIVPDGVYPYVIEYKGSCKVDVIEKTGMVTVFR